MNWKSVNLDKKPLLDQLRLEKVIHACITSRLDYCNVLYFGVRQSSFKCLQLVQNAANWSSFTSPQFWPPFTDILALILRLFIFKSLNWLTPPYLPELCRHYWAFSVSGLTRGMTFRTFGTPPLYPALKLGFKTTFLFFDFRPGMRRFTFYYVDYFYVIHLSF